MMSMRISTNAVAALALVFVCTGEPRAEGTFHSGGVGHCGGCHATHTDETGGLPGPNLLRGANATDTCLACHETDNGNTWGASQTAPGPVYGGGSFIFLTEDNLNDGPGGADPANWIGGHRAGHNVVSPLKGVTADPDRSVAPGGSYPSIHLTCTSCHDPHGKAGHYRLLYGSDTGPSISDGHSYDFVNPAPQAMGIALDGPGESRTNHPAYLSGISMWCASCHNNAHSNQPGGGGDISGTVSGGSTFDTGSTGGSGGSGPTPLASLVEHPVDERLDSSESRNYDEYDGTGFWDTGDPNTSYIPEVSLESPTMTTGFTGPTPDDARITCLTCHRAHASSAPSGLRWDDNIASWDDEGRISGSFAIPNPYEATAGPAQQRLCEKCHGDDIPN